MRTLSYTFSLPDCSLLLLPASQTKVVEGLPIYFQAFVLCTMHLEDTGTTATFLGLGCHFHSVLEQTILNEYYSCLSRWQSPLMHDCIIKTSFHNMKTLPFHFTSKTDSCHDSLKPILTKVWHCCHFFVTSLEENTMATKCQTDFMAIKASHPFFCCWTKWNNLLHMIQNDISPC